MQAVILFDGVCNLCNHVVQFVIARDPHARFKFASLQGEYAAGLRRTKQLEPDLPDSLVLIENDKIYLKSDAVLKIARQLKGPVRLWYGFIIVPGFIRNKFYDIIVKNRYRWFGKRKECMVPANNLEARFIQ